MRNKEGLVDDLITSIPGEWKFDEQVSQHFDTHVRKSVPLYEEVQKAVIEISEWFIRDNSVVYDLEGVSKCTPSLFYVQSPDFHKLGLCYYLKILYL